MAISEDEFKKARKGDGIGIFGGRVYKVVKCLPGPLLGVQVETRINDKLERKNLYYLRGKIRHEGLGVISEFNNEYVQLFPQCQWA